MAEVADDFHRAMLTIYQRAKQECKYTATYFLRMVGELGSLRAAKQLLNAPNLSDGFTRLWECGRLDLTVEALVLQPKWRELFSADECDKARIRLKQLGYSDSIAEHS